MTDAPTRDMPDTELAQSARERRRRESRERLRRQRQLVALAVGALAVVALIAFVVSSGGRSHANRHEHGAGPSGKASIRRAPVDGGPLAPLAVGGLQALWASQNVVGEQPGTPAAYQAASTLPGMPGYLMIADRGNDRVLVVDAQRRIVFHFPTSSDLAAGRKLVFDDDVFVEPGGAALIANEEDHHDVVQIGLADHSLKTLFGHPGEAGSDRTHLHTPDDAYMLPDGSFTLADAYNCRILFVRAHRIVREIGRAGVCRHDPPRLLGAVNGDTPLPGGGVLISEVNGSWIDEIDSAGRLVFSVAAPVSYPSDPQPLPRGRILLADYANPGHVLIIDRRGRVLWRYGPAQGRGALNHPSLAIALPNGDIAVNDDYRDRVVVIDPRTKRIVWQYGHVDRPGTRPGHLNTPDGMDFVPAGPHGLPDYAAVAHP
jgi:hypothetical protein